MSRVCEVCGKVSMGGNIRSHANNRTKRRFSPNLQRVRISDAGRSRRAVVCTSCLTAGKVRKPSLRPQHQPKS